jgi:hypothetical protein
MSSTVAGRERLSRLAGAGWARGGRRGTTGRIAHAARVAGVAGLTVGGVVVGMASPAAADAPAASDYESVITGVSPSTDAVEVSVTGAGAFLDVRAEPGHEVVVLGYEDEPYLRIDADGTVETNLESPATYANATRSGDAPVPDDVDPTDPPRWQRVGGGGRYAWHDHRIHWMGTQPPADVERGGEIKRWTVPLSVDGEAVSVEGTLTYADAVPWWPWPLVVAAVAAAAWWIGRRSVRVGVAAAGLACALGTALSGIEQLSVPAEAGRRLLPVLTPAVGTVCAVGALMLLSRRRRPDLTVNVGLSAVAAAVGWGLLRLAVFTKPVLVTDLEPVLDRTGTTAVLGLSLAATFSLIRAESQPASALGDDASAERSDTDTVTT